MPEAPAGSSGPRELHPSPSGAPPADATASATGLSRNARRGLALLAAFLTAIVVVLLVWSSSVGPGDGGGDARREQVPGNVGELVTIERTLDSFDRPDQQLEVGGGVAEGWAPEIGAWAISGGQAFPSEPTRERSLLVRDLGQSDVAVQAELSKVSHDAGVVFRYQDPSNYWAVVAAPYYGTWVLFKVLDGKEEVVATTGLSETSDGTTVGLRGDGDTIDVVVNERVTATVVDGALRTATKAGMTAQGTEPRFENFKADEGPSVAGESRGGGQGR